MIIKINILFNNNTILIMSDHKTEINMINNKKQIEEIREEIKLYKKKFVQSIEINKKILLEYKDPIKELKIYEDLDKKIKTYDEYEIELTVIKNYIVNTNYKYVELNNIITNRCPTPIYDDYLGIEIKNM